MEFTEIVKLRREVLRRISRYTFEGKLPEKVRNILYEVVTEETPRYRCCVHKERAVLKNRIYMAMGLKQGNNLVEAARVAISEPLDRTLPIIDVLPEACAQCPVERFMVTDMCRHCLNRKCISNCPRKAITIYQNRAYIDHHLCIECGRCKASCPYGAIIEITRPCERACALDAIHPDSRKKASINKEVCVECGSCRGACPFGAIDERGQIVQIICDLKRGKDVYILLAPSFVTQFGLKARPGQIVAAFKAIGFKGVLEVAVGADMTVLGEAHEFCEKVPDKQKFMTNSCCPAFVNLVQQHMPECAGNISTTVSPMVATGRKLKAEKSEALTVFVGPCITKKAEARQHPEAIDYVMTFEEAMCMLEGAGVDVLKCEEEEFVTLASTRGNSFPLEAGVGRAVSAAVERQGGIDVKSRYAAGLTNCLEALKEVSKEGSGINYLEGMACPQGCVSGPGAVAEPGITRVFLRKFADNAPIKESDENQEAVQGVAKVRVTRNEE